VTDKEEQEWIKKYRAAIEAAALIKEPRWKTLLKDGSRALGTVGSAMRRSGQPPKFVLRKRMLRQPAELGLARSPVTTVGLEHRPASVLRKPISIEHPASAEPRRGEQRRKTS